MGSCRIDLAGLEIGRLHSRWCQLTGPGSTPSAQVRLEWMLVNKRRVDQANAPAHLTLALIRADKLKAEAVAGGGAAADARAALNPYGLLVDVCVLV